MQNAYLRRDRKRRTARSALTDSQTGPSSLRAADGRCLSAEVTNRCMFNPVLQIKVKISKPAILNSRELDYSSGFCRVVNNQMWFLHELHSGFSGDARTVFSYSDSPQAAKQISSFSMMQMPMFEDSLVSSDACQPELDLLHTTVTGKTHTDTVNHHDTL